MLLVLQDVARQWRNQRGEGAMSPNPENKLRMVGNGGPITGCLIHIVTKYREYKDACVRFSFPFLPFRKGICHNSDRIKLGILHVCCWLQRKRRQSNDIVISLNVHDD